MSLAVLVALIAVAVAALLHAMDLAHQEVVQRAMDGVLTRRGRDTLEELGLQVREQRHVLSAYHGRARRLRAAGHAREAQERMRAGCQAMHELAPEFLSALSALRQLARAVSVIVTVAPLSPSAFETRGLRGIAGAAALLHDLLVTGGQRVRLRLAVAAGTFRVALHWLQGATDGLAPRPADGALWARLDGLVADIGTAGDAALVAARHVVQALDAVELGATVVHHSADL